MWANTLAPRQPVTDPRQLACSILVLLPGICGFSEKCLARTLTAGNFQCCKAVPVAPVPPPAGSSADARRLPALVAGAATAVTAQPPAAGPAIAATACGTLPPAAAQMRARRTAETAQRAQACAAQLRGSAAGCRSTHTAAMLSRACAGTSAGKQLRRVGQLMTGPSPAACAGAAPLSVPPAPAGHG